MPQVGCSSECMRMLMHSQNASGRLQQRSQHAVGQRGAHGSMQWGSEARMAAGDPGRVAGVAQGRRRLGGTWAARASWPWGVNLRIARHM